MSDGSEFDCKGGCGQRTANLTGVCTHCQGRLRESIGPEQVCNRKACRAPNAFWWNTSTRAYYCQPCAFKINDANPGLCIKLTPRSERPREWE